MALVPGPRGGRRGHRGPRSMVENPSAWLQAEFIRRDNAILAAQQVLGDTLRVALVHAISDGLEQGYRQLAGHPGLASHQRGPTKALADYIGLAAPPPAVRKAIHLKVGAQAKRSMSSSYGQNVTRNQSALSRTGYRKNDGRLAGGRLRDALNNKAMVEADENTLRFLNFKVLDEEAAHWYRLNFGAGPRGRNSRQGRYEMVFGGATTGVALGFNTGPSVSPVVLPPGFFLNAEGKRIPRPNANPARRGMDIFAPVGEQGGMGGGRPLQSRITKGIEARNFLDAGLRRIAEELPLAYEDFFRTAAAQAGGATRVQVDALIPALGIGVKTTLPSRAQRRFGLGHPNF